MDINEQEKKFYQALDQLSHSMTRLTNTMVSHMTERLPQLYAKTKLHLLSSIGGLSKAVVKVQQAWNELAFFRQKAGLASTEEPSSPLLAKDTTKKRSKRTAQLASASIKRGRKKTQAVSNPLEECKAAA